MAPFFFSCGSDDDDSGSRGGRGGANSGGGAGVSGSGGQFAGSGGQSTGGASTTAGAGGAAASGGTGAGTGGAASGGSTSGTQPVGALCVNDTNCSQSQGTAVCCQVTGCTAPCECRLEADCSSPVSYLECDSAADCANYGGGKICCRATAGDHTMQYCTKANGCSGEALP